MENKERPIIFSSEMVRAILDGRKTQTRRVAKVTSDGCNDGFITPLAGFVPRSIENHISYCPYGVTGDKLWVRETSIITPKHWNDGFMCNVTDKDGDPRMVQYIATDPCCEGAADYKLKKTPSIFMPRWASRILLEITNVRVERLNDISEEDAIAEGIEQEPGTSHWKNYDTSPGGWRYWESPIQSYRTLLESINGEGSWDLNPFVWVIEFKVLENGK